MYSRRSMILGGAVLAVLTGVLVRFAVGSPNPDNAETQTSSAPTPPGGAPKAQPDSGLRSPAAWPQGPLLEGELRTQLIDLRQGLCNQLELVGGIIVSTGILPDVPPIILAMTGLPIDELEAKETQVFQRLDATASAENMNTTQLLDDVRIVERLVRLHLTAMDRLLMENPHFRPINAEGSFAAFFKFHNLNITEMRKHYLNLVEEPSLAGARAMAMFWQEVLGPHARAEERSLFPLARKLGDEHLERSANLVEAEHKMIDQGIAKYMATLEAIERGQEKLTDLLPVVLDVRMRAELHFAKEEQSVVRPLQETITSHEFDPVIEQIDQAVGPWLRKHGWDWKATSD